MPSMLDPVLRETPELDGAVTVLRALVDAARSLPVELPSDVPHADAARARIAEGLPALAGEPLVSAATLIRNMRMLAAALTQTPSAASAAGAVQAMLDRHGADLSRDDGDGPVLVHAILAGDTGAVAAITRRLRADDLAVLAIADHAVRPALRAGAERVRPLIEAQPWTRGKCPACGAPPLLAELRGEGERWLRCGRCASAWIFPRVGCPLCGTRDHRVLGYLHLEGEGEHRRADRCDGCGTYVKAMAVLGPLTYDDLLEADLATVALDLVAMERGYRRP